MKDSKIVDPFTSVFGFVFVLGWFLAFRSEGQVSGLLWLIALIWYPCIALTFLFATASVLQAASHNKFRLIHVVNGLWLVLTFVFVFMLWVGLSHGVGGSDF